MFQVMNPIGNSIVVNGFMGDLGEFQRRSAIRKVIVNCLAIGIGSLIAGHLILRVFGLAIPVIQLGGGLLICRTGWARLATNANNDEMKIPHVEMADIERKLFYPIAFPFSFGPGSISVVLTLLASATIKGNFWQTSLGVAIIGLAILIICLIFYIFLLHGPKILKGLGDTVNMIINKLVAFFSFCIGLQIVVMGVSKIFHLNIL